MERVSSAHTITKATENTTSILFESDSEVVEHKRPLLLKYVVKQLSNTRSKIESVLVNTGDRR